MVAGLRSNPPRCTPPRCTPLYHERLMGLSPDNAIMVTNISDITACAHAAGLPMASRPEEVGLSSQRLRRISDELNADAEQGKLPGAVALVARRGKVAYFEAVGVADPDKR